MCYELPFVTYLLMLSCFCVCVYVRGGRKISMAAVQSADQTKILLTSPAAAEAAAAALLVSTRLMAEWALPCPAVPLLPPHWKARWNWARWHYRAQPDHTVKRDYAVNRHAHKQHAAVVGKKDLLFPAWIKTGKRSVLFLLLEIWGKERLKQKISPSYLSWWTGINVCAY